ncbi:MAG: YcxB family protein [Planctomycetaceae bacterium]
MKLRYSFLEDDYVDFNRYHFAHSPSVRKQRFTATIVITLSVFVAFMLLTANGELGVATRLAISLIIAAFAVLYLQFAMRRNHVRQVQNLLREGSMDGVYGPQELEVDDAGIRVRSKWRDSFVAWPGVRRIEDTDEFLIIYVSAIQAHVIRRSRIVEGDPDKLAAFVRSHLENHQW